MVRGEIPRRLLWRFDVGARIRLRLMKQSAIGFSLTGALTDAQAARGGAKDLICTEFVCPVR